MGISWLNGFLMGFVFWSDFVPPLLTCSIVHVFMQVGLKNLSFFCLHYVSASQQCGDYGLFLRRLITFFIELVMVKKAMWTEVAFKWSTHLCDDFQVFTNVCYWLTCFSCSSFQHGNGTISCFSADTLSPEEEKC